MISIDVKSRIEKKKKKTVRAGHLEILASTSWHLSIYSISMDIQIYKLFFTLYESYLELKFP